MHGSFWITVQVFQIFLLCFLHLILTINLPENIHHIHSTGQNIPDIGLAQNFLHQISLLFLISVSYKILQHEQSVDKFLSEYNAHES